MRTVVPTSEVAHMWAHQLQSEAYSAGSKNFYFRGKSIYSYGHHYEVGRIVNNPRGEKAYLINDSGYSNTTAKHIGEALCAIPKGYKVFFTHKDSNIGWYGHSETTTDDTAAISRWVRRIADEVFRLHNARNAGVGIMHPREPFHQMMDWVEYWSVKEDDCREAIGVGLSGTKIKLEYHKQIRDILMDIVYNEAEVNMYSFYNRLYDAIFGKDSFNKKMAKIAEARLRMAAEREERDRKARERWEKERKIAALPDMDKLQLWHDREINNWHPSYGFASEHGWHTALRLTENKKSVESSKGIRVNLEEAKRLWTVFKSYHAGHEFCRDLVVDSNGNKWRCDSYKNDVFNIGCHSIPYSEAERVALQLGWA